MIFLNNDQKTHYHGKMKSLYSIEFLGVHNESFSLFTSGGNVNPNADKRTFNPSENAKN